MYLSDKDKSLLDGKLGKIPQQAIEGLIQLGQAYDAPDMVDIGYAHVHAGMAMYLGDVELMEELAKNGASMTVPVSTNIANADMGNWQQSGAPEKLVQLQRRAETAHKSMGSGTCFTCTPYWAGHWPTWNMHIASIESGVTIFSNSILGAMSNRDGFFSVYAGITGRYPRFGLHLDENRKPTHHVHVEATPTGTADFTVLGYAIGKEITNGIPVVTGLMKRPNLDELDALGVGMATSGGIAMFILPGVTPPYADDFDPGDKMLPSFGVGDTDLREIYSDFCSGSADEFDIVHLGCPHASFEEMKHYAALLRGRKINSNIELWITTSRNVQQMAKDAGMLVPILASGARVISDTCPIACHLARTCSPHPDLGIEPTALKAIVVDSAKQAQYIRDMIQCPTFLTTTEKAVETAISGHFVPRY